MIRGHSNLHRKVLQSMRMAGLAAGFVVLVATSIIATAEAGARREIAGRPAIQNVVDQEALQLGRAQALGRSSWRGGERGGRAAWAGSRGVAFGARIRPRAAAYSWAAQARDVRRPPFDQTVQTVQYGGGGGRWGWRGGRGGGGQRGGFQAPDVAARSLRNQGYSNVDPLTRRGRSYVGEATGPMGQRQRVIIDGNSGRVMGASPLGPPVAMPPPGAGWYGGY